MVSNLDVLKKVGSDIVNGLRYVMKSTPSFLKNAGIFARGFVEGGFIIPTTIREFSEHNELNANARNIGRCISAAISFPCCLGLYGIVFEPNNLEMRYFYGILGVYVATNVTSGVYEGLRCYISRIKEELENKPMISKESSDLEKEVETTEIKPDKFVNPWEIEIKD